MWWEASPARPFTRHVTSPCNLLDNITRVLSQPSFSFCLWRSCRILTYGHSPHTYSKSMMDQPGKVANPARGQLNREKQYFPVCVRAWESGLARRIRQSRPASACSSPHSGWIWCLLTGFLPSSAAASIYLFKTHHTPSGQSRVHGVTQLRTDGVHCREFAGTGPVNLKVVPNECRLGRSPWTN